MYDSDKIKEILAETERQDKIFAEIDELNSQIMKKRKIITQNYDYKRLTDEQEYNLSSEEKAKFERFKADMSDLHRELEEDYRKIDALEEEVHAVLADEYLKRKEFCDDLNKYIDLTNKINDLEESSAKLSKYSGYKMVTIKDDLGNDKQIYELATATYTIFIESRKELTKKLMDNYKEVVDGYDNYVNKKNNYHTGPKKSFEDEWLTNKAGFKEYILNELNIKDPLIANKLLKEYDKGIFYNEELIRMLYRLGIPKKKVDDIAWRFGYCKRPDGLTRDVVVVDKEKTRKEPTIIKQEIAPLEKEEPKKKKYSFKIKSLTPEKKKKLIKSATRITVFALAGIIISNGIKASLNKKTAEYPIGNSYGSKFELNSINYLIGEPVNIIDGASVYENMYDAVYDNNRLNPYFDDSINHYIMGIVYENQDGELVVASTLEENEQYIKEGLNAKAVLTGINGEYEGFYRIDNIEKRGITR